MHSAAAALAVARPLAAIALLVLGGAALIFLFRPSAPLGVMDLLLYTSLDQFRGHARWASLGLAPVAGPHVSSLFSFKAKFQPSWEPRFLVAERSSDWFVVALATLQLHYPRLHASFRTARRGLGPKLRPA